MKTIYFIMEMNLQLFTGSADGTAVHTTGGYMDATTGTNTSYTSGSSLSDEMVTFYNKTLLDLMGPKLVHQRFCQKDKLPQNAGKVMQWRVFSPLAKATTPLVEGVTPAPEKMNVSALTATLAQYGRHVELSDLLQMTAIDPLVVQALKRLADQAGRTIDTVIREVMNSGTQAVYCPTTASGSFVNGRSSMTSGSAPSVRAFLNAAAILKANNAPTFDGYFVALIHPYVAYAMMQSSEWKEAVKYTAANRIFDGEVGTIGQVKFIETSEAKIRNDNTCPVKTAASGSDPAVYYSVFSSMVLGDGACGSVELEGGGLKTYVEQLGSAGAADPLHQRSTVGWKADLASRILIDQYMVRVESVLAEFDTAAAN